MNDRTLPAWLHVLMIGSALAQIVFGLTLLADPSAISRLWPWALTPLAGRLLGASALVAVPLSLLASLANRWSAARIPTVMQLAYRVMQLIAGAIHIGRFDFSRPVTWNYYGGGSLMLLAFAAALLFHQSLGKPVNTQPAWLRAGASFRLGAAARALILTFALLYLVLGIVFFALGAEAAPFWIEPAGQLTSLTARLFSSPTLGLALGLWLLTRARRWSEVVVPACGMVTFGLAGVVALALGWGQVAPPSPLGYLTAATPIVLFLVGAFVLASGRRDRSTAPASAAN